MAAVLLSSSHKLQHEVVEGEDKGKKAMRGVGVESWEGRRGGVEENRVCETGELRGDPHTASSRRVHVAAATVDNKDEDLDGRGVEFSSISSL